MWLLFGNFDGDFDGDLHSLTFETSKMITVSLWLRCTGVHWRSCAGFLIETLMLDWQTEIMNSTRWDFSNAWRWGSLSKTLMGSQLGTPKVAHLGSLMVTIRGFLIGLFDGYVDGDSNGGFDWVLLRLRDGDFAGSAQGLFSNNMLGLFFVRLWLRLSQAESQEL